MNVIEAAQAQTTVAAALAYAAMRISVLPCRGKEPAVKNWSELQQRRASIHKIQWWERNGLFGNVGVICGDVSENLVVIDLDGDAAINAFNSAFPAWFLDTYTVASGSGHGAHLYYYAETLPPTTRVVGSKVGNVELRANGCYVVAPPSIHPVTGKPYVVSNPAPIRRVPHLREVVLWVKDLMREKHGGQLPPARNAGQITSADRWAQAALTAECAAVRMAAAGARNNTLNRAAFKLGQLIKQGRLARADVENALYEAAAALAQTDGEATVLRTIKSGIEAGLIKPIWRDGNRE